MAGNRFSFFSEMSVSFLVYDDASRQVDRERAEEARGDAQPLKTNNVEEKNKKRVVFFLFLFGSLQRRNEGALVPSRVPAFVDKGSESSSSSPLSTRVVQERQLGHLE